MAETNFCPQYLLYVRRCCHQLHYPVSCGQVGPWFVFPHHQERVEMNLCAPCTAPHSHPLKSTTEKRVNCFAGRGRARHDANWQPGNYRKWASACQPKPAWGIQRACGLIRPDYWSPSRAAVPHFSLDRNFLWAARGDVHVNKSTPRPCQRDPCTLLYVQQVNMPAIDAVGTFLYVSAVFSLWRDAVVFTTIIKYLV